MYVFKEAFFFYQYLKKLLDKGKLLSFSKMANPAQHLFRLFLAKITNKLVYSS